MARKGQPCLRRLVDVVARAHPELEDPAEPILAQRVWVDRRLVENPASFVRADAAIRIDAGQTLRGEEKLGAGLERFEVDVDGRVALDLGSATGGFTRMLLRAGAARVYAVDVGYGQLLGSLRQDARVVNLERTNISELDRRRVPDDIGIVTADLSYLSLARGIAQLNGRVRIAHDADLVVVKPQFELRRSRPPTTAADLTAAVDVAKTGIEAAGWAVRGTLQSPVRGSRGAIEFLLHAVRVAGWT
jgi:23S rRNA (cytidine1920-2'-O)/16S rRNA (cytidine1409-2'-O)-methyltransferase